MGNIKIEFKCGHLAINPEKRYGRWICPECNAAQPIKKYEGPCKTPGCNGIAISHRVQVKYCPKCKEERARTQRNRNAKRRNKQIRNKFKNINDMKNPAMTWEEIAQEMGTSVQNVHQIAQNAILKFRKKWMEMYPDLI